MPNQIERKVFAERLNTLLDERGYRGLSCKELIKHYNRHSQGHAVTVHALRKWLAGKSVPTQARIRVLAHWLGVSPEWLCFGDGADANGSPPSLLSRFVQDFMADYALLDQTKQEMMRGIITALGAAGPPEK